MLQPALVGDARDRVRERERDALERVVVVVEHDHLPGPVVVMRGHPWCAAACGREPRRPRADLGPGSHNPLRRTLTSPYTAWVKAVQQTRPTARARSTRARCAPTSRSSSARSTATRSPTWTPRPRRRSRARCWTRWSSSTSTPTPTCTAASTRSPSRRPRPTRGRATRSRRSSARAAARECVFTRNATEALNLVAYSYGKAHCGPGDVIVATEMEHHSNIVPWQLLAQPTGAKMRYLRRDRRRPPRPRPARRDRAGGRVQVVAAVHQSNSLGTLNPIRELADWAHERGARGRGRRRAVGAAPAPSTCRRSAATSSRSRATSCCGPSGAGALWGREELLEDMPPFLAGGEMIRSVALERTSFNEPALEVRGRHARDRRVRRAGRRDRLPRGDRHGRDRRPRARDHGLRLDRLAAVEGVTILGPPAGRSRRRRVVHVRVRPSARRGADPRPPRRLRARRPPLHAAADAPLRRAGDHARELLPVHGARGDRPPLRRARGRARACSA